MMDSPSRLRHGRRRKTINACQWCRSRKIKCTGNQPCSYCLSRRLECVFTERPKKILVSQEYLQALQLRASQASQTNQNAESQTPSSTYVSSPPYSCHHESTPALSRIPDRARSTDTPRTHHFSHPAYGEFQNSAGDQYRRFGHSSAWAFSRRVRMMMGNQLEDFRLHDEIPIRDGAYGTPWKQRNLCLAGLELPTVEYAEYLVNTTWFATCSLYYLFDKKTVLSNVERFYAEGPHTAEKHTELWHIQLILIFAFGISILAKDVGSSGPRGTEYFARAMEVIPDGHRLAMNAVTSVEVLSLVALFMQSIDMRFGAQQYIDQAVRLCYSHCMHREFDPSLNTENEFEHRSKLWWTVYIIERKLCSLIGAPSALFDEDLCLELPSIDDTRDKSSLSRAFHVRISSQLGQILNVIYGPGPQRQLGCQFISASHSILEGLGNTSVLLNAHMKIELQDSVNPISRTAASLHLLHHQCSILVVRPVLFTLLARKLEASQQAVVLSDVVLRLLRLGVESALQTLRIVNLLKSHKLLDSLIPNDLEYAFVAAFVLILSDIFLPTTAEQWDLRKTYAIFDEHLHKGICIAGPYKKDLAEIFYLQQQLLHCQKQGQVLTFPGQAAAPLQDPAIEMANSCYSQPQSEQELLGALREISNNGAIYPDTIQQAAEGLEFNILDSLDMDASAWMFMTDE